MASSEKIISKREYSVNVCVTFELLSLVIVEFTLLIEFADYDESFGRIVTALNHLL
jgi:hypothetical protein